MPGKITLQQAAEALATPKPSAQKGPSQRNKQVLHVLSQAVLTSILGPEAVFSTLSY